MNINYGTYSIEPILEKVRATVRTHELGEPGKYARWIWQNAENTRDLGVNAYGCADAANILYTLGNFPAEEAQRCSWIRHLQALQDPQTGAFNEATHFSIHTTAHCIAALELFDQKPLHPIQFLHPYLEKDALFTFLDELKWVDSPWNNSHKGAGLFVSLVLSGAAGLEWKRWYFDWLYEQADPETGLWRKDCIQAPGSAPVMHHMASTFHYLFNHEFEKMPLRYPEKVVDTCLQMFYDGSTYEDSGKELGTSVGFIEVDWVYCLNRAFRQSGHRAAEVHQAVATFTRRYVDYLSSIDETQDDGFNDLHSLFGAMCALAEVSQSVYGILQANYPLRLVLDRRPFI